MAQSRAQRWRRRIARTAALLIAGFVIQWGVAWGCALTPMDSAVNPSNYYPDGTDAGGQRLAFSGGFYAKFGAQRRVWTTSEFRNLMNLLGFSTRPGRLHGQSVLISSWAVAGPHSWGRLHDAYQELLAQGTLGVGAEDARGWPALSLWSEIDGFELWKRSSTPTLTVRGGLPLEPSKGPRYGPMSKGWYTPNLTTIRALPYRPIWSGIAFNTLFYALLLWLLLSAWRIAKERRRMLRGRCPKCRYDLGFVFAGGCSECGWRR